MLDFRADLDSRSCRESRFFFCPRAVARSCTSVRVAGLRDGGGNCGQKSRFPARSILRPKLSMAKTGWNRWMRSRHRGFTGLSSGRKKGFDASFLFFSLLFLVVTLAIRCSGWTHGIAKHSDYESATGRFRPRHRTGQVDTGITEWRGSGEWVYNTVSLLSSGRKSLLASWSVSGYICFFFLVTVSSWSP